MNRRDFLKTGLATTAALSAETTQAETAESVSAVEKQAGFKLKYAPHFGMFHNHAGDDPIDQFKYMADQGFRAFEDNGLKGNPPDVQEKFAKAMQKLGIEMGIFVANGGTSFGNNGLAMGKPSEREHFLNEIRDSVEVAKRINTKVCTVVPGERVPHMELEYQTANVIDILRRAAEICEKSGLVMVLEPLNHWRDHPNLFLASVPQTYMVCRAVNSPSCKILYDMYHAQIQVGNIIPNIDKAWSEIGYFQIGDTPGRNEPLTGEMNYKKIFQHIHQKGFQGILGMEHGNSIGGKEGELAVIQAYRTCDDF